MKKQHILLIFGIGIISSLGVYLYLRYSSFQKNIVRVAKKELEKWTSLSEKSVNASSTLVKYWKSVGIHFNSNQMQSEAVQSNYPWSSAFISYLFFKAGAKEKFPYASSHSGYFQVAKANRDIKSAPLRGFRINEYAPKVGDLVVYSRELGAGYDTTGFFASHGELVIEIGNGFIKTVGGNVSNTVKSSRYTTNQKGMITKNEHPFFMVIQNNIR